MFVYMTPTKESHFNSCFCSDNEARGAGISEPLVVCCVSVCGKKKLLSRYFYSLAPFSGVSTKYIDSWVLEFVISNITGNNHWENCISLDFSFCGLSGPPNQRTLEPHD
jgi:hypothetical protein